MLLGFQIIPLLTLIPYTLAHPAPADETPDTIEFKTGQEFVVTADSSQARLLWRDFSLDSWLFPVASVSNDTCTAEPELSKRQQCRTGSRCGPGCCNPGNSCCSGQGCCDPGEKCAKLTSGQLGCCPSSAVQCSSGGCCSSSEKCCGKGCAPASATCCASGHCLSGTSCCGSDGCYKPATQQCCSSGGACSKDETCCGSGCCVPGASCRKGQCFRQVEAPPPPAPSPAPSPPAPSPAPPPPAPPAPPAPPPPSKPTAIPKETFIFDYQPNKKVRTNNGKRIPLSNKAVLISMCEGLKQALGAAAQEIQLTKDIPGRDERRDIMCPDDWCKDGLQEFFDLYPELDPADFPEASIMECDEFPFANSKQGGNLAKGARRCIPRWQNNWQGGKLSRKLAKLDDGDDYLVKIKGWDCDKQAPTLEKTARDLEVVEIGVKKREDTVVTDDLTEDDVYVGFEDSDNALLMPLGTLEPGEYTYSLQLTSGSLSSSFVSDYLGTQLYTSISPITSGNGKVNITFQVPQRAYGVGLVAIQSPSGGNISLSYSAANATVTQSPSNDGIMVSTNIEFVTALCFMILYTLL